MTFTGETIHGWRIAERTRNRRTFAQGHVSEPVLELVKGHDCIRVRSQDAPRRTDPEVAMGRAVRMALETDVLRARQRNDVEAMVRAMEALERHVRWMEVHTNARLGRRVHERMARAVFAAPTAGARSRA